MHEADNSVSSTEDTSTNTVYDTEQSGYSNKADHDRKRTRIENGMNTEMSIDPTAGERRQLTLLIFNNSKKVDAISYDE